MQIRSNNKFRSLEHRVQASRVGPRVSVACFITAGSDPLGKVFGPINGLVSEENPPLYRDFRPTHSPQHSMLRLDEVAQTQQVVQSKLSPAAPSFLYQPSTKVSLLEAHFSGPVMKENKLVEASQHEFQIS
ncbi:hypothetical protein NL676_021854 [Syzygium grande]|nr:hypothetical protein NL676_021854 [Syzygium grande]